MDSIAGLAKNCRIANNTNDEKVLNSECAYTFHTPYTTSKGILVDLNHWIGMCEELALKKNMTNDEGALLVRIVKERVAKKEESKEEEGEDKNKITKLAIGVEGGFTIDDDKYDIVSKYSIVKIVNGTITAELQYTEENKNDFPTMIASSADSIINHVGYTLQQDVKAWELDQDEIIPISKYATDELPFVDNGVLISPDPKQWKCQKDPSHTENLWLNLSDGYIGGGRKNWDGSGGSNGALDHYTDTGKKYPLVIKLGTITPNLDQVDCYSYADEEDGPVKIPYEILKKLLIKRGININLMSKTEKSTSELEVELNATYEFDAITESNSKLIPIFGPGYQGLQNLGNTCYMNSILQTLFNGSIHELATRYGCPPTNNDTSTNSLVDHIFLQPIPPKQAPNDVLVQTTKIASALTSGVFAEEKKDSETDSSSSNDPKYRLAPRMFKHLIGKDHIDFRTGQQQDTAHYLLHFLELLDRAEIKAFNNSNEEMKQHFLKFCSTEDGSDNSQLRTTSHLFSYKTTSRLVCNADGKVKYTTSNAPETVCSLRLPMEKAKFIEETEPEQKRQKGEETTGEEKAEEEKKVVPTITFEDCLESWASETTIDDIRWKHLEQQQQSTGTQTVRFANFPKYLIIQIQRYTMGDDWVPKKLEVNLKISSEIDITKYKSVGKQDNEELIPDDEEDTNQESAFAAAPSGPAIDENALAQLMDMGFSMNGCKRALTAVGGSDIEAAMNWVFEHSQDPDFNDPMPEGANTSAAGGDASGGVDDAIVSSLVENLGCFTSDQVRAALKECNNAPDRAADWLFSHMDDLDGAIASLNSRNEEAAAGGGGNDTSSAKVPLNDSTNGKYRMIGMVSHIGKNTGSGHYVAHVYKKDKNQWVIYNDEKVAISESPPFEHAYMYFFERTDVL